MAHRFLIKEVANQAGLSTATVDRVLNGRAHVSARAAARVQAALGELARQEQNLAAKGRTVWVDVVVEAPERFSRELRRAAEAVLGQVGSVVIRPRFSLHEVMSESQMIATLRRIAKRGSQGVCLKARDLPGVRAEVAALIAKGIPVVTIVTDIDGALAYAGLDNEQAGQVAATLIARQVKQGCVLTSQSREDFAGEATRIKAFEAALKTLAPAVRLIATHDGGGLNPTTARAVGKVLADQGAVHAVYSVGGGNRAICAALDAAAVKPHVYVAHDLDADNLALLAQGAVSFVLYHDLEADMHLAYRHILRFHRLISGSEVSGLSDVQIILPANVPAAIRGQSGR